MSAIEVFKKVKKASLTLNNLKDEKVNEVLVCLAKEILDNQDFILEENLKDLEKMDKNNPVYDRLLLNSQRLISISNDIKNVSKLDSPLGRVLSSKVLENGLKIKKVSVPLGVIGMIYEARPNVTLDVFSLCFKSGNAVILKGGSDAYNSNLAIVSVIKNVLKKFDLNEDIVGLLGPGHEEASELLVARDYVDLLIPRGSSKLINYVRENAKVPVIETGAGVCHTYIDEDCDVEMAARIINNGKTRRISVCNALDCMIINKNQLKNIATICAPLQEHEVKLYADFEAYKALQGKYPENLLFNASVEDFGREFQDYKLAIKTVDNVKKAVDHISKYSSKHSESIVSKIQANIDYFDKTVDAACVYTNAPTSWTDGAQFGLGAEFGISTQKMHARGPMALDEMTTYKWIIKGEGQVRS